MKKIFLLTLIAAALLAPGISKAQTYTIPNGSFESWSSQTVPLNWTVPQGSVQEVSLVKWYTYDGKGDTSRYEAAAKDGSEAIEIVSNGATPGEIVQKFPFTGKPPYFSMNYSYFPGASNDQCYAVVILTKWNPAKVSKHDTLVSVAFLSPAGFAAPWQTLLDDSLTAFYNTKLPGNEMPDTAIVAIVNSRLGSSSALFVDQIWFSSTLVTTGIDQNNFQSFDPSGVSAYPNPFTGKTDIHYNLTQSGEVSLNVFDMEGRQVAVLVNGTQEQGPHDATFDASGLKNGIYFYRLQSGDNVQTGKMMLAR